MINNVLKLFLKDDFVIFNIAHASNQTPGLGHHARTHSTSELGHKVLSHS